MWHRFSTIFLVSVICISVVGYFVGLHRGIPDRASQRSSGLPTDSGTADSQDEHTPDNSKVLAAVAYAEIPAAKMGPTDKFHDAAKSLPMLPTHANYDLFAEVKPSEADKAASHQKRAARRAYNGAPPIIPHSVQNTNDSACYACHSKGMQMAGLKASVMSHQFLANCTQCHAPPPPAPFNAIDSKVATDFVGLPAPKAGERAYPGAPPTIPHSQWMRENCLACHGGPNGWTGMESTHPWRSNCTQCHAPSALLDQAIPVESIPMLPALDVVVK
jgi:nitrate reductase (cytochrome), electron transfer subunit